jgi:hypothetical protein
MAKKGAKKMPVTETRKRMSDSPIRVDMSPELRKLLKEEADYESIPMSAFIRRLVIEYMRAKGRMK